MSQVLVDNFPSHVLVEPLFSVAILRHSFRGNTRVLTKIYGLSDRVSEFTETIPVIEYRPVCALKTILQLVNSGSRRHFHGLELELTV